MRIRGSLIAGVMAAGLAAFQGHSFCATALARSAHAFYQCFQALRQDSLNPVESFVFSLVLANPRPEENCNRGLGGA
jgi:hypothetical protein